MDRSNLGRQARSEFQQFDTPDDGRKFTELYNVQHLARHVDRPRQPGVHHDRFSGMYSILAGEELDRETR